MSLINSGVIFALRNSTHRVTNFVHSVIFGNSNLLITNALISATMGAFGDSIQQNYDIMMQSLKLKTENNLIKKENEKIKETQSDSELESFSFTRTIHMTMAGLSTGVVTHYWYILLDKHLGVNRAPKILAKKILLDQILFSPINLFGEFKTFYFTFTNYYFNLLFSLLHYFRNLRKIKLETREKRTDGKRL